MRIVGITHTDWTPNPNFVRQPFADGGRLHYDRHRQEDWDNLIAYELAEVARINCIAIGCRGTFDPAAVAALPHARRAYDKIAHTGITTAFWCDTVGPPDATFNRLGAPFDLANPQHYEVAWNDFFLPYFNAFKGANMERTEDGRLCMFWWGIAPAPSTGHGYVNQHAGQRWLDDVSARVEALGLGKVAHYVDKEWARAENLNVEGMHNWFDPWAPYPVSYTTRRHGNVVTGVVVPGYSDPGHPLPEKIPGMDGSTARVGLEACRLAGCQYVILEGITGFVEGIEWMRWGSNGNPSKLLAIRDYAEPNITQPAQPVPLPTGAPMIALTPITDAVTYEDLIPGEAPGTFAWIIGRDAPTSEHPEGRIKIYSLEDTGKDSWRYLDDPTMQMPAAWESGRKFRDGQQLVFRTGNHVRMFWLTEGI